MNIKLPVSISGTVLHGNHIGTGISMPTANILLPKEYEDLPYGVYYSKVTVSGSTYKGITNVGLKPTVQDSLSANVETFIYDFEGDLYGKTIQVMLLEFRRPEQRFESIEELSRAMHADLEAGKNR